MIIVGEGVAGAAFAYQQARRARGLGGWELMLCRQAAGRTPRCAAASDALTATLTSHFLCRSVALQGCSGRRVLLLERDLSQPDRIVGELLQVRCWRMF